MRTRYIEAAMGMGGRMTTGFWPGMNRFWAKMEWPSLDKEASIIVDPIHRTLEEAIEALDQALCDDAAKEMIEAGVV